MHTRILSLAFALVAPLVALADDPLIVPLPVSMKTGQGAFALTKDLRIHAAGESRAAADLLAAGIKRATSKQAVVDTASANDGISLRIDPALAKLGAEGYCLEIAPAGVKLTAAKYAGIANGVQTLLQLLPLAAENGGWSLPALRIEDRPAYPWRGMMLDVSRQFLDKEFVLRFIDMMALHKLNVLHFHLVDDAGWRLEIRKYPKLTEIGGFRGEGEKRTGGFYTQADIREIVAYAKGRNITVVPEIELPAHSLAAIAAYPELSCTGQLKKVPAVHFISDDLYCAGKETTWKFLRDVFDETCELFPSTYIHIGGDEAKYTKWKACPDCQKKIKQLGLKNEQELQGWMTIEVEKYLKTKGRHILGWDELLECKVSTSAGVMSWHNPKHSETAAKLGHPVVAALTRHAYFDTPYSREPGDAPGTGWIPPVSLRDAYEWHPTPDGLTAGQQSNILGPHGCVWTDQFLHKPFLAVPAGDEPRGKDYVEFLTLPRAAALAEVGWTPKAQRDFADFEKRMTRLYARYAAAGWTYRMPIPEVAFANDASGGLTATVTSAALEGGAIHYTVDGSRPTAQSPRYTSPVKVAKEADFRAANVAPDGKRAGLPFQVKAQDERFAKYGDKIGEWKSGKVGNRKPLAVDFDFDATGKIDRAGVYEITFVFTGGKQRLDIDSVEVFLNQDTVAREVHHGRTGATSSNNTYRVKIDRYETGAAFKVRAAIYGDEGDDSNGVVLIKRVQ